MHPSSLSLHPGLPSGVTFHDSLTHKRLMLALQCTRQLAFDWHIPDDELYFSGELVDEMKTLPLDTAKVWSSSLLPEIMHPEDKPVFMMQLREILKGRNNDNGKFSRIEVRLKDSIQAWRWMEISGRVIERSSSGRAIRLAGTFCDVGAHKAADTGNIAAPEEIKNAIWMASLDCIISINREGKIIGLNRAAETTFGYRCTDVLGRDLSEIMIPPEWREKHSSGLRKCLSSGQSKLLGRRMELTAMRADGSTFPIELAVVPLGVGPRPIFTAFIRDISERKLSETIQSAQNHVLRMIIGGAPLSDILRDIERLVENQSSRAHCAIQILDRMKGMRMPKLTSDMPHNPYPALSKTRMHSTDAGCNQHCIDVNSIVAADIDSNPTRMARKVDRLDAGTNAHVHLPLTGKDKSLLGTISLFLREDVAAPTAVELELLGICARLASLAIEARLSADRIRYLAHYDGLTSLPNRFLFEEYLDLALRDAQRHASRFAVLFLDLDRFKAINDTHGHDVGDQVLCEVAARMRNCLRQTDKIARMGGDEFYVLIEDITDIDQAEEVAEKLLKAVSQPIRFGELSLTLSASIGASVYPVDGRDGKTLLKNADIAMYRIKDGGKNGFRLHSRSAKSVQKNGNGRWRSTTPDGGLVKRA